MSATLTAGPLAAFRLSPQQERLWELLRSGWPPPAGWCVATLAGDPEPRRIAAALERLAARHEILRTVIEPGRTETPRQLVTGASPRLGGCDLSRLDAPDRERCTARLLGQLRGAVGRSPAARPLAVLWLRLAAREHRLLLALPATNGDAATWKLLLAELSRGLGDPGTAVGGEPEVVQYGDVAEWLLELAESPGTLEGRRYWRRPEVWGESAARLPFERAERTGQRRHRRHRRRVGVSIGEGPAGELGRLSGGGAGDLEAVLFAGWRALLFRLTAQRRLTIGSRFDGRSHDDLRAVLGPLARYLPVTCEVQGDDPFEGLAGRARALLAEHRDWQHLFRWDREPGVEPAGRFRVGFEHEDRMAEPPAGSSPLGLERWDTCAEPFVVRLASCRRRHGLELELHHEGCEGVAVARAAGWLRALLEAAARSPRTEVSALPLLGPAERHQLAVEWQGPRSPTRRDADLWDLVAASAAERPEAVASIAGRHHLSYAELVARAARVARDLRRAGVGPETRVALRLERSIGRTIALLGVLGAGGAFVPIDPEAPAERTRRLLADARPALVLEELASEGLALDGTPPPAARSTPDRAAYVVYTSGSTGAPKGVVVSQRAIVNRLLWTLEAFPGWSQERLLQKTPEVFDASIWEIFVPLIAGGSLVLAAPGEHRDVEALARTIAAQRVTALQLVPSQLVAFLEQPGVAARCRSLRRLFCGGERLGADVAARCRALLGVTPVNLYGPTEVAIDASFHRLEARDRDEVPIGRPLTNVEVHLLDAGGRELPVGVPGELCVGGWGLARGYLGRPALTAERFVPSPFEAAPGGRLYRTGDLARLRADGEIDYLGRRDHQVKLRGMRIELGEIEAVLREHPAVSAAVVVARSETGEARLVAAVVGEVSEQALRRHAAERLPEHMVPPTFAFLDELPRLPSGKVDRGALERLAIEPASDSAGGPARSQAEGALAEIWCELLGVASIGREESFFAAGGHSLLASRLVARVRERLGVDLTVRDVFTAPTLAGLARRLLTLGQPELPPLVPVSRSEVLPLSHTQEGLWFLEQLEGGSVRYCLPMALRARGDLHLEALEAALAEVVRRHEILRTRFPAVAGHPRQEILPPPAAGPLGGDLPRVDLPRIDLRRLDRARREGVLQRVVAAHAWRPFDLPAKPPLRLALVHLDEGENALLATLHHIACDGWSMEVFRSEVAALYRAFAEGRPSPLPELPVQLADYASWQRRWLAGEVLEAELAYWQRRLEGAPDPLPLPADHPRPPVQSHRGAETKQRLSAELTTGLRELSRREGVTLFMTLLGAVQVMLAHHTGCDDVVVGSPAALRDRTELEGMIGCLVNLLPLRAELGGDPTFRELLGRVRRATVEAQAHQEAPFDLLVDRLQLRRDLSYSPLVQVGFALQEQAGGGPALGGLELEPIAMETRAVQYDLTFNVLDAGERLFLSLGYTVDLFRPTTARRLLAAYATALGAVVERPGARLTELRAELAAADGRWRAEAEAELRKARSGGFGSLRRRDGGTARERPGGGRR